MFLISKVILSFNKLLINVFCFKKEVYGDKLKM